ncbi:hypothetical protein E8E01_01010 [Methylorubrum populi]|uniref:hypothetical protein n=1 Tax=Methylorubrum populi TaxID=223967 RepID=UPI001154BB48|nr:hypothetical protein [Methylorubrum populi]QDI79110.1 hypothetical protein E8E01_01010 [Methylorubrum populi]
MQEVAFYEQAILWSARNPREAHEAVLARDVPGEDPSFPELRLATLAWIVRRLETVADESGKTVEEILYRTREIEAEQAANRVADKAREAAFRRDPGRWLKDATPLAVPMLRAEGCWIADRDGEVVLCTHASSVCGRDAQQAVEAAYTRALKDEYRTVVIVGAPGLGDRVKIPDAMERDLMEIEFEVVEIPSADVTGPAPTNGGRAA